MAVTKAVSDSANNNHAISEPSYQNTSETITHAKDLTSSTTPEENNNSRSCIVENGHGKTTVVSEEVDGVPKSHSVDTRNNNTAALGDSPAPVTVAAAAAIPTPSSTGAVSKEGNVPLSHLERLYDNQEMVIRMMTANLGRRDDELEEDLTLLDQRPLHPMYDIPVSPPAGE